MGCGASAAVAPIDDFPRGWKTDRTQLSWETMERIVQCALGGEDVKNVTVEGDAAVFALFALGAKDSVSSGLLSTTRDTIAGSGTETLDKLRSLCGARRVSREFRNRGKLVGKSGEVESWEVLLNVARGVGRCVGAHVPDRQRRLSDIRGHSARALVGGRRRVAAMEAVKCAGVLLSSCESWQSAEVGEAVCHGGLNEAIRMLLLEQWRGAPTDGGDMGGLPAGESASGKFEWVEKGKSVEEVLGAVMGKSQPVSLESLWDVLDGSTRGLVVWENLWSSFRESGRKRLTVSRLPYLLDRLFDQVDVEDQCPLLDVHFSRHFHGDAGKEEEGSGHGLLKELVRDCVLDAAGALVGEREGVIVKEGEEEEGVVVVCMEFLEDAEFRDLFLEKGGFLVVVGEDDSTVYEIASQTSPTANTFHLHLEEHPPSPLSQNTKVQIRIRPPSPILRSFDTASWLGPQSMSFPSESFRKRALVFGWVLGMAVRHRCPLQSAALSPAILASLGPSNLSSHTVDMVHLLDDTMQPMRSVITSSASPFALETTKKFLDPQHPQYYSHETIEAIVETDQRPRPPLRYLGLWNALNSFAGGAQETGDCTLPQPSSPSAPTAPQLEPGGFQWLSDFVRRGFHRAIGTQGVDILARAGCLDSPFFVATLLNFSLTASNTSLPLSKVFRVQSELPQELQDIFWNHVDSIKDRTAFLSFLTGAPATPLPLTETLRLELYPTLTTPKQSITILGTLPVSHTCTNTLQLPDYLESATALLHLVQSDTTLSIPPALQNAIDTSDNDPKKLVALVLEDRLQCAILEGANGYGLDQAPTTPRQTQASLPRTPGDVRIGDHGTAPDDEDDEARRRRLLGF